MKKVYVSFVWALLVLVSVDLLAEFDEKKLALNFYIASFYNEDGYIPAYAETSLPIALSYILLSTDDGFQDNRTCKTKAELSLSDYSYSGNTVPGTNIKVIQLSPFDPSTLDDPRIIAGPSVFFRLDVANQIVTVTVEDAVGAYPIIHSKETVYLEPVLSLIKQAVADNKVTVDYGGGHYGTVSMGQFTGAQDSTKGSNASGIGLHLFMWHDGRVSVEASEFFLTTGEPDGSCFITGTINDELFKNRCVKSVPYKMLKQYSGVPFVR